MIHRDMPRVRGDFLDSPGHPGSPGSPGIGGPVSTLVASVTLMAPPDRLAEQSSKAMSPGQPTRQAWVNKAGECQGGRLDSQNAQGLPSMSCCTMWLGWKEVTMVSQVLLGGPRSRPGLDHRLAGRGVTS